MNEADAARYLLGYFKEYEKLCFRLRAGFPNLGDFLRYVAGNDSLGQTLVLQFSIADLVDSLIAKGDLGTCKLTNYLGTSVTLLVSGPSPYLDLTTNGVKVVEEPDEEWEIEQAE